jgi:hypothetical protein
VREQQLEEFPGLWGHLGGIWAKQLAFGHKDFRVPSESAP